MMQKDDKKLVKVVWPKETSFRKVDDMIFSLGKMERGKPKRTMEELIKGDLRLNNISRTLIFNLTEWRYMIHVVNLT